MAMNRDLSLGERLLLHIRAGGWHPVASVRDGLESFLPPDRARERYRDLLVEEAVAEMCGRGLLQRRDSAGGDEVRATPRKDERFEVDPEFQNLLPRAPDEVAALEALVLREGCRDALTVWEGHDLLIDGYSRWALLSLLGWPCAIQYLEFADRDAVMTWMWQQHCGRRNLTPEAKSYAHGRAYIAAKQSRGGDRKSKSHSDTLILRRAADELAMRYGIGRATLYREAHFAEALDKCVANTTPEIRRIVLSQAVGVTRRQVLRLAGLPAEVQQRLVAEVITSRKPPRFIEADPAEEIRLSLPLGEPHAQAKALAEKLGPDALHKLLREIKALLRSAKGRGNGVADQPLTNGHGRNDSHGGRSPTRIRGDGRQSGPRRNGSGGAFPWPLAPGP
jgi:hypothetical protein